MSQRAIKNPSKEENFLHYAMQQLRTIRADTYIRDGKSRLNTIHLPYKHDSNNINGFQECFVAFCIKFCIVKIVKRDFFGIAITEK